MTTINRKTVMEKYDEFSRLETLGERRELFGKQSEEMRVTLWIENIDRKTKGKELSAEQKEILNLIKEKFITVEFARLTKGKIEEESRPEFSEYNEIMSKATELLGRENLRELFVILGDGSTLRAGC